MQQNNYKTEGIVISYRTELLYITIINVLSFAIFAMDKKFAKKRRRRVPEATLFFFSAVGGATGGYIAMRLFHHKTKKGRFKVAVPALIIVNAVCFLGIAYMISR